MVVEVEVLKRFDYTHVAGDRCGLEMPIAEALEKIGAIKILRQVPSDEFTPAVAAASAPAVHFGSAPTPAITPQIVAAPSPPVMPRPAVRNRAALGIVSFRTWKATSPVS